jgi:enolase-phosphatase E1
VLDVEGTTTPLAFVSQELFPFARRYLRPFLNRHAREPAVAAILDDLIAEHARERASGRLPPSWPSQSRGDLDAAAAYLEWLMDQDRKSTPLKTLQGFIWEEGFRSGRLRGQVFDDVPVAFGRWREEGLRVAIFSSGSVLAQRLLFSQSTHGDLSGFLTAHFDTTLGPKRDPESYRRIASALTLAPVDVLFISDLVEELDAARVAGCRTLLAVRAGNAPVPAGHGHPIVERFDHL